MVNLELKKKEAERIINNACISAGALKFSEMLLQDDKKKTLAEHQMKMVTNIFSVYGIDCLAGLTKKFEETTSLVEFGNGLVSLIVKVIPKAEKIQNYIKPAAAAGLTKAVGTAASKISYSYVEKHIKGIPVKLEDFYTDPDSAGIIATLFNDVVAVVSNKFQGKEEKQKDSTNKGKSSSKNNKKKQ